MGFNKKSEANSGKETLNPEQQKKVAVFFIIGIVLVIILAVLGGFKEEEPVTKETQPKPKKQATQKKEDLKADILITEGLLSLKNENSYNWTPTDSFSGYGVILTLNGDFKFFYRVPIQPGELIKVPLTDFTKKGMRFNIFNFKPKKLQVICKENVKTFFLQLTD